jgi:hypothetical protein
MHSRFIENSGVSPRVIEVLMRPRSDAAANGTGDRLTRNRMPRRPSDDDAHQRQLVSRRNG